MGSFKAKAVGSSKDVLVRQKGKPVIYVEGESDKRIFEQYWFVELLEKVSFDTTPGATGCSAVVRTVADQRIAGLDAYGIVDRDKLMADGKWTLLRETNDGLFDTSWPYPSIKITKRWELESYLIEPDALEAFLAPAEGGRPPRTRAMVEADLLSHADALVPFAALNQAMHLHSLSAPKDGYTALDERPKVEARIAKEKLVSYPQISVDYINNIPLIDAFSGSVTHSPRDRLHGLLKIVNGKAMLERVKRRARLRDDITYLIAKEIKQLRRVPEEIEGFVRQCCV